MLKIRKTLRDSKFKDEAIAAIKKETTRKTTIDIPEDLFNQFKAKIALDPDNKNIKEFINKTIKQYLSK